MLFKTIASLAFLATAANAASLEAKRQPYRLAVMPLPGQSLMRRDTNGYKPDQKHCKAGNTCAEACGPTFDKCPSAQPDVAHCFNPAAGQSCCTDNSGNSCEAGFYCTHDNKMQTWCCPHDLDLAACAAAFGVTGLEAATAKPVPSTTSTTSTTSSTHTSTTSTTSTSTTSSTTSQTPKMTTTSASSTTIMSNTTTTMAQSTTICTASAGNTTAWAGSNSTITTLAPSQPSEAAPFTTTDLSAATGPASAVPSTVNAAAASGVSAFLLAVAGFVALL
ncbi:hypothetical protein E4U57_001657 [Claviceps arundinis]|uniref:Prp 4 CRoW domain-containing protein n=1 Tax=Claviceps arundinis TaxID=1623583 RepID=A0A9P7N1D8_9HYPO|nr:hypothetical protein E4U57_001657 [Claviceps arundinis]KAG5976912.1 hypothetical protein E4U56_001158 [Claviceps arundinis]